MNRTIQIKDIAVLNRETYRKDELPEMLYYLDTANFTKNNIKSLQKLNINKDKIPSRAQRKIKENTILYSTVRPNQEHHGIFEREIENIIVSTGFTTIDIVDEEVNSKYLYYLLIQKHLTNYLHSLAQNSVSSYPSISPNDLGSLEFKILDLRSQKQIAKVLSDLDAKIEVNNQINAKLEAMAKTLYEYWFVQFDFPFDFAQGKPSLNGKPYKSSGGKMVYNEELKREIPDGWEVKTIKDLIKSDKNGDWGKAERYKNYVKKVNCIRGTDLNGLNGQGNTNSPTRFILEKNEHKLLNSGDFIIEISGGSPTQSTGRIGMVIDETFERFDNDLICSNFCRAISLNDEYYTFNFFQFWNRIYKAGVLFGWEGKTSGIKNFLFDSFISKYKIAVPNNDLTKAYYNAVKPYYSKIQKNLVENKKLAELRDWLLPMLMNGQVTVGENPNIDLAQEAKKQGRNIEEMDENIGIVAEEKDEYNSK